MAEAIKHRTRGWCVKSDTPDSRLTRFSPGQRKPNHLIGRIYRPTDHGSCHGWGPVQDRVPSNTGDRARPGELPTDQTTSTLGPLDTAMADAPRVGCQRSDTAKPPPTPKRPRLDRDRLNERPDERFGWTRPPEGNLATTINCKPPIF